MKLKTKISFKFLINEEIPELNYKIPLQSKKRKINIINVKKTKDSSINTKLY